MTIDTRSKLYYEEYGPKKAKTIIFIHGAGLAGWMWHKQVEYFKSKYHCLVPDLPEQGKSESIDKRPFTIEGAADRIAMLIKNKTRNGRAYVIGLSQGAQVTTSLLSRHPEVVDRAIVSSALMRPLWITKIYTPTINRLLYVLFIKYFKNNDWYIKFNMKSYHILDQDYYYKDFKTSIQQFNEKNLFDTLHATFQFRMPDRLEKIKVPVLIVVGNKEYEGMKQSAKDLVDILPNSKGVIVSLEPHSTMAKEHAWALSAPNLFNRTAKAWIEGRRLPTELLPL